SRELHDAELEILRLAALVDGIERTRGVPASVQKSERARVRMEIDMRLGELHRRERCRQKPCVGQTANPGQRLDDTWVLPRKLTRQKLGIVLDPEFFQECLVNEVRTRE